MVEKEPLIGLMHKTPRNLLLGWTDDLSSSFADNLKEPHRKVLMEHGINVVTFGISNADIRIDSLIHDYDFLEDELKRLDFIPDIALIITGFGFVMEGIEKALFPVVMLSLEWFFNASSLMRVSKRVDFTLVSVRSALEAVRRVIGEEPLFTPLPLLEDPTLYFKPLSDTQKCYDVIYLGYINARAYAERTRYLERLASLPEKYAVFIGEVPPSERRLSKKEQSNLFNNQARICVNFNNPKTPLMNPRIINAFLSHSFVLTEHLEDEKEFLLEDRVHCAFFGEQDLEEKISCYLENQAEREAIANNGSRLAHDTLFSFTDALVRFLGNIEPFCRARVSKKNDSFSSLSKSKQWNALGVEAYRSAEVNRQRGLWKASQYFGKALELSPNDNEFLNNKGVVGSLLSDSSQEEAVTHFKLALASIEQDPIVLFNMACVYREIKDFEKYLDVFNRLTALLGNTRGSFPHLGVFRIAHQHFLFNKKHEELLYQCYDRGVASTDFYDELVVLLSWMLNSQMGNFLWERQEFSLAKDYFKKSCELVPDSDEEQHRWGVSLAALGNVIEAKVCFEAALRINPFNFSCAGDLLSLLFSSGDLQQAKTLAQKYALMSQRVSHSKKASEYFRGVLAQFPR